MIAPRRAPRPAGPGRAGGGLNETPRPFSVTEAQRIVSALGPPERVRALVRWGEAFAAVAPGVLDAWPRPAPVVHAPPPGGRPIVASTLQCPSCGAEVVRHTAGGGGRPRTCRPCGVPMRVMT